MTAATCGLFRKSAVAAKLQRSIHYGTRLAHFRHNLTTLEFNKGGSGVGG